MTHAQRYMERYTDDWDFMYKLQKSVIEGTIKMEASHLFNAIYFAFVDGSDIVFMPYGHKKFSCAYQEQEAINQDSSND